ncbi:MAG TPA: hypothetical protein VFP61_09565 [Acidimicrobiales bacterium]|nr:hypothetical protein [Acidimicrobiales bacterium]
MARGVLRVVGTDAPGPPGSARALMAAVLTAAGWLLVAITSAMPEAEVVRRIARAIAAAR